LEALFGKGWYLKFPADSRQFRSSHFSAIAKAYDHVWELDDEVNSDRTLNEIDEILFATATKHVWRKLEFLVPYLPSYLR
jgi:hypothetical protein